MQIGISQRDPKFTLDEKTYIAATKALGFNPRSSTPQRTSQVAER
ncbi:hypothetical protein RISK_005669 [Rhodopirellula islandica]|uniref:Uncharacterized protein n=1 Tax=Rhodopirellula islandica TaxID=595434 RepID=A0A0J1B7Q7_RHOIS|nr:hypothetical protein RISK_005669 [Rhodopirellula islandica]